MAEQFNADLDIVQATPIELELLDGNLNVIQQLDDEPNDVGGLTSAELKAKFDQAGLTIQTYINETLIPQLEALGVGEIIRHTDADGKILYLRLGADRVLETSEDGETWEAVGSRGHLIIAPDGTEMPQRSRMRIAAGTVTDNGSETVIEGIQGPQGAQGDQGPAGPGVPVGGSGGQVLRKASGADFDTEWADGPETATSPDHIFRSLRIGDIYRSYRDDIETLTNGAVIAANGRNMVVTAGKYDEIKKSALGTRIAPPSQSQNMSENWNITGNKIYEVGSENYLWTGKNNAFFTWDGSVNTDPTSHTLPLVTYVYNGTEYAVSPTFFASADYFFAVYYVPTYVDASDAGKIVIQVYNDNGTLIRTTKITPSVSASSLSLYLGSDGCTAMVFIRGNGGLYGYASADGFSSYQQITFDGATVMPASASTSIMSFFTPENPNPAVVAVYQGAFYIGCKDSDTVKIYECVANYPNLAYQFTLAYTCSVSSESSVFNTGCILKNSHPGILSLWIEENDGSPYHYLSFEELLPDGGYPRTHYSAENVALTDVIGGAVTDSSVFWFSKTGKCIKVYNLNLDTIQRRILAVTFLSEDDKSNVFELRSNRNKAQGWVVSNQNGINRLLIPLEEGMGTYDSSGQTVQGGLYILGLDHLNYVYITTPFPITTPSADALSGGMALYADGNTYYKILTDSKIFNLNLNRLRIPDQQHTYIKIRGVT